MNKSHFQNWVLYLNSLENNKKNLSRWIWKRAPGDVPVVEMLVDEQPSAEITIQKEYSYFSGINLSFLTYGKQSGCSQCINLHHAHTPDRLEYFQLMIDPVVALWSDRGGSASRLPRWDSVQEECGSIQAELLVAVLQKHRVALWSTSTWKHLSGSSPTPHGKASRANTESVIRDSFNIDRFLCQRRDNIVYCGVFLLRSHFLHQILKLFH